MDNHAQTNGDGDGEIIEIKKKTQGRKKIQMKKIADTTQLQVTFSKRRYGLFKKASELCVLCGAQIAVIATSPGKHVFTFGHPTVDAVVDLYLTGISNLDDYGDSTTHNYDYSEMLRELEAEKKTKEMILHYNNSNKENEGQWWEESYEELELEELELYESSMEDLKKNVLLRADELGMMNTSTLMNDVTTTTDDDFQSYITDDINYLYDHTEFDPFNF